VPKVKKRSLGTTCPGVPHSFQFAAVCRFKLAGSWRESGSGGKKLRALQDQGYFHGRNDFLCNSESVADEMHVV